MVRHFLALAATVGLLAALAIPASAANSNANINAQNAYTVHNLVSNLADVADRVDPNLVNGWGLTAGPSTPWWVADNGTDKSTLYRGDGSIVPLVVDVASAPTGVVFNAVSTDFEVGAAGTGAR